MTLTITKEALNSLKEYLKDRLGLDLPEKNDKDLIRKMENASADFGYKTLSEFIDWILNNRLSLEKMGRLASYLTIGETYFMREKDAFNFLSHIYLPGLISKRYSKNRKLRIWCAGCSSGEEAYSLAIILLETISNIKSWDITIMATDINPVFLNKARKGIYSKWSFRKTNEAFISKYFTRIGENELVINEELREMVSFSQFNLASDNYPPGKDIGDKMDIIFCRNVFIYMSQENISNITKQFYKTLTTGGILVLSTVEMPLNIYNKFNKISSAGLTVFHKGDKTEDGKNNNERPTGQNKHVDPDTRLINGKRRRTENIDELPEFQRLADLLPAKETVENSLADLPESEREYTKAMIFFQKGYFSEAETILLNLLNNSSLEANMLLILMAKIKASRGNLSEAEEFCKKAVKTDRLNPELYYLYATIKQEMGDIDLARSLLKQSIYLDSDFVLAHFLLGTLYLKSGEIDEGKRSFRNAKSCLVKLSQDSIIPESDGMSVGGLREIIEAIKI